MKSVIAIFAHPDDIEFAAAGTLLLLKDAGWKIHYVVLSSGNLGSDQADADQTRAIRANESRRAAAVLEANYHPPIADDLEISYDIASLRQVASVIRRVAPDIVLTHSPQDYMEDHTVTSRLAVTAAFTRGMPNFETEPPLAIVGKDVTVYHAMPHGLCDQLRKRVSAGAWVDVGAVMETKRKALAAHGSQKEWLDVSQGMDSYLSAMEDMAREVGKESGVFEFAEGWRRHLHYGFSASESDPLAEALGDRCKINEAYEENLKRSG